MDWRVHPQVQAFVAAGHAFASLIASAEAKTRTAWLPALLSSTLSLYAAGLALPDVAIAEADFDTLETFAVSREEWEERYRRLGETLGADRWYAAPASRIGGPTAASERAVGDLADDLTDIYRDVMPGLRCWDTNGEAGLARVVWEWRFSFLTHWGQHAVAILWIVHALATSDWLLDGDRGRPAE